MPNKLSEKALKTFARLVGDDKLPAVNGVDSALKTIYLEQLLKQTPYSALRNFLTVLRYTSKARKIRVMVAGTSINWPGTSIGNQLAQAIKEAYGSSCSIWGPMGVGTTLSGWRSDRTALQGQGVSMDTWHFDFFTFSSSATLTAWEIRLDKGASICLS